MDLKPTDDNLEPQDYADLAVGNYDAVSGRLGVVSDKLKAAITSDRISNEVVAALREELRELARIRLEILVPDALDALEVVAKGLADKKKGMSQVRAAEAIMDRSFMPKQTRVQRDDGGKLAESTRLPSLDELVKSAKSPEEAMDLVNRHKRIMDEIDEIRRGAKQIIEGDYVRSTVQEESKPESTGS